jgi:polysaccharide export outer membrane protein
MNARLGGQEQISEPVTALRRHGLCFLPLCIALIASFLLATNPAVVNAYQLQGVTHRPSSQTDGANGSLGDRPNRPRARIQRVGVSRREQLIEVRVTGDGLLSYRAFPMSNPDRLVLDFSGAVVQVEPRQVASDLEPILRVRLGQFSPDVARVVIDLKKKLPYTVGQDSNSVTVVFEPDAETSLGGVSDAKVAFIPNIVLAKLSPPYPASGDFKESSAEWETQAQAVGNGSADDQAKPWFPALAEAFPAEGQGGEPAAPTPAPEITSELGKAETEPPAVELLPEGVRATSSEQTVIGPSKAQNGSTAELELGSASSLAVADRDDPAPETRSSLPGPLPEAGSKANPIILLPPPDQDYVIGIDDVLAINVWKESEISRIVFVRPDGKISIPLIGEVKADGLTPVALQTLIATELRSYLYEPEVTVAVQEMRSQRFNMVGEVNKPGTYQVSKPMTVLDAIALAGGLRDFAKATKIYVLRVGPDGSRNRLPFNYKRAIQGARDQGSLEVKARDTIVVP